MDILIAILVALLSSGLISTIINLYAQRWQPDHQSNLLAAWENEVSLLTALEFRAKDSDLSPSVRKRYGALAIAGEAQILSATAQRLVPQNLLLDLSKIVGGFVLLLSAGLAGIPFNYYLLSTGAGDPNAAVVLLIYSITLAIMGIVLVLAGWLSTTYRDVMRRRILALLGGESFSSCQHGDNAVLGSRGLKTCNPGAPVEFTKFAEFALPLTQRRIFSDFVQFGAWSDSHLQTE